MTNGYIKICKKSWIDEVKRFNSLSEEERGQYCLFQCCENGCCLCEDISVINGVIVSDEVYNNVIKNLNKLINEEKENTFQRNT